MFQFMGAVGTPGLGLVQASSPYKYPDTWVRCIQQKTRPQRQAGLNLWHCVGPGLPFEIWQWKPGHISQGWSLSQEWKPAEVRGSGSDSLCMNCWLTFVPSRRKFLTGREHSLGPPLVTPILAKIPWPGRSRQVRLSKTIYSPQKRASAFSQVPGPGSRFLGQVSSYESPVTFHLHFAGDEMPLSHALGRNWTVICLVVQPNEWSLWLDFS